MTALPNVQTMPTMTASAPTLPFFLSLPGFQVPFFPTFQATPLNGPSLFGHTSMPSMPIYIVKEPPKLKIPDNWDGTKEKWPLFKMKVEMA